MTVRGLFVGAQGRLRALWRLLLFFAVVAIATMLGSAAWMVAGATVDSAAGDPTTFSWILLLALLAAHWVMISGVDRLPWSAVWLGRDALRGTLLARGLLIGCLAIGVPSLLLLWVGWLRAEPAGAGSWAGSAARMAALLVPAAFAEELMLRGYVLAVLRDAWGWRAALAVTSLVFGVLHLPNPGSSAQSVSMVVLAGIFLGLIVLVMRSLYAAAIAHFGWNFTMAAALHAPVSGLPLSTPGYRVVDAGPDWATGGIWGPEGGALAAAGMLVGSWYLLAARDRGRALGEPMARPGGREELSS